jgi:hypothetical protein
LGSTQERVMALRLSLLLLSEFDPIFLAEYEMQVQAMTFLTSLAGFVNLSIPFVLTSSLAMRLSTRAAHPSRS